MKIGIYNLISDVNDRKLISESLNPFLKSIEEYLQEPLVSINPADIKKEPILPIIMIQSGEVEEKFKRIYQQFPAPYLLMASCLHNSLPAALEIKEYLKKRGEKVEILHGSTKIIAQRLKTLKQLFNAKKACRRFRMGVLGKPADWLIGSGADYNAIRKKLGIRIFDIPIEEMIRHIDQIKNNNFEIKRDLSKFSFEPESLKQSLRIYQGLKNLAREYKFNALTVRCYDLLSFYKNKACLAFSFLNEEGIIAGCEGDVPSAVSMIVANQLTNETAFMVKPVCIDQMKNEIIFNHCIVPINIQEEFLLKSHFESRLGSKIYGKAAKIPITILKLNGNADNFYCAEGETIENLETPQQCGTQIKISLEEPVNDFLEKAIANHHIIFKGHHKEKIKEFFSLVL